MASWLEQLDREMFFDADKFNRLSNAEKTDILNIVAKAVTEKQHRKFTPVEFVVPNEADIANVVGGRCDGNKLYIFDQTVIPGAECSFMKYIEVTIHETIHKMFSEMFFGECVGYFYTKLDPDEVRSEVAYSLPILSYCRMLSKLKKHTFKDGTKDYLWAEEEVNGQIVKVRKPLTNPADLCWINEHLAYFETWVYIYEEVIKITDMKYQKGLMIELMYTTFDWLSLVFSTFDYWETVKKLKDSKYLVRFKKAFENRTNGIPFDGFVHLTPYFKIKQFRNHKVKDQFKAKLLECIRLMEILSEDELQYLSDIIEPSPVTIFSDLTN